MITKDKQHGKKSQVKCRTNLSLMREGIIKGKGFHDQVLINQPLVDAGRNNQCCSNPIIPRIVRDLANPNFLWNARNGYVHKKGAHKMKGNNRFKLEVIIIYQ